MGGRMNNGSVPPQEKAVMLSLVNGELAVKVTPGLEREDILKMLLSAVHVVAMTPPGESRIARPNLVVKV